jgi:hypothetical protein
MEQQAIHEQISSPVSSVLLGTLPLVALSGLGTKFS